MHNMGRHFNHITSLALRPEGAAGYSSASQKARVLTETWLGEQVVCPACGRRLRHYEANRPVADFLCAECRLDFELKSKKGPISTTVNDGAYRTMIERITSEAAPSFFFLQYDAEYMVRNLFVTPAHYFTPEIIEKRPPLKPTARRAGWVGCNILTKAIPASGRIYYVRDGQVRPTEEVCEQYHHTAFLSGRNLEQRGWLIDVMTCVERLRKPEFTLQEMYAFESHLAQLHPDNHNIRPKIRQQLQFLRDAGYLTFASRGCYKLTHY